MRLRAFKAGLGQGLGRISGLIRDVVFASFFGAGATADAFFVAFRVQNLFRELLAEGTLSNIFVPLFAETEAKAGITRAWALANALAGVLLAVLGVVTALIFFAAEPMVLLLASGFEDSAGKVALAAWLTRLMAPFLAGISLAALFGGMLNVRGRFFLPAVAPAILNVGIIIACVFGPEWSAVTATPAIGAVAVAATVSGLLTAAIQLPALKQEGFHFRPTFRSHPAMGRVLKFMGAALVGVVVVQFNLLVELQLASRLGDGAVSWLLMGFRLVQLPMSVIAGAIAVAALARFSVQWAKNERDEAKITASDAIENTMFWVLPASVGLFLLADPLVEMCFERGAFGPTDTLNTANVLRGYAVAVAGICATRVLLPIFFAIGDPYTPMRLSVVVMIIKIPVAMALLDTFGLIGLPLSHALTVSGEALVMMLVLRKLLGGWRDGLLMQIGRIVLASTGMGCVVYGLDMLLPPMGIFRVLGLCAVGGLSFGIFAAALKVSAIQPLLNKAGLNKFKQKRRPGR
jgi:putative peptidoglycan lipid II flippase